MKVIRILWTWGLVLFLICGCSHDEEQQEMPSVSVSDTITQYLNALIKQDGMTMAQLTVEHNGFDFTISEADAQELGMDLATAQKFYEQLLTFEYTLEMETVKGDQAEIVAHINTYDLEQVLSDIVEAHKEEFGEIYDMDIEETEKSQKIASMIVDAFAKEAYSYQFDVTFHLQLIDQVWLIDNADEQVLFQSLFQQK